MSIQSIRSVKHFYESIPGDHCCTDLCKEIVGKFSSDSTFVVVGVGFGRMLAFLGVEIFNKKKNIELIGVDEFSEKTTSADVDANLKTLAGRYRTIRDGSTKAAGHFFDQSVDFVFLDANRERNKVTDDIVAWLPKVRHGGVIAGFGYCNSHPGVVDAVERCFLFAKRVQEYCWIVEVK